MRSLRRNLRQLAIAWIVVPAVSLSALAGFDCCAAHQPVKRDVAPLLVLLSNNGIPSESPVAGPDFRAGPSPNPPAETFIVDFESPDPPPPRV